MARDKSYKQLYLKIKSLTKCYLFNSIVINGQKCKSENLTYRVVCFYDKFVPFCILFTKIKYYLLNFLSSAIYRPVPANFKASDFDPCLCTHVIYRYAKISNEDPILSPEETIILPKLVNEWKSKNPKLKVLISVGGWYEGVSF